MYASVYNLSSQLIITNNAMEKEEIWKITLAQIEVKLDSPAQFKTWFKDTTLLTVVENKAMIGVKNSYTVDWLKKKHHKLIKDTLSYVYGNDLEPDYEIDKGLINRPQPKITAEEIMKEPPMFGFINNDDNQTLTLGLRNANLNETNTFHNYIVGASNKLAHAAAIGVAQKPGLAYNPLFIYGKTGLGKTHLGQAVARYILEREPMKKMLYISSEGFLNDMVKSIKSGKNLEFRQRFRSLDLLIIDDIQLISKWQETQNEFFNTFNVLYNDKKQIILISDRPPEEIKSIEDRLRSRFQGGITVDVGRPDFEMRVAILQSKANQLNLTITESIIESIAKLVTDNIRELEGALQKIALYQSMFGTEITLEEVAKIIGKDKKSRRDRIKIPQILKVISKEFNVTVKELKGPRRTADLAFARQVCMYFLREEFGYKLEQVAKIMERQDHTTVMHAVDKIKSKMMVEEGFKNQLDMIKEAILNMEESL
jgi:chromosomal replication initiator protein